MRRAVAAVGFALLLAALPQAAPAQTATEQLAQGVRAYQNIDYDGAAVALRAALARSGPGELSDSERVRALVYLGATDLFGGGRDSAVAAFGRLLLLDPRYRIDQLVFPPEVTGLFQQVRMTTRAAALVVPAATQLRTARDRLYGWLYVASFHPVDVGVVNPAGALVRMLYQGGIGDSLQIAWDGRAADGTPVNTGQFLIRVDSHGTDGRIVRSVGVPLDVTQVPNDTLLSPPPLPDSAFKPESVAAGSGLGPLLTGLAAAVAVVALPSLVAGNANGMGERFVVAGALGIAGVVGFPLQRRPRPLPENIAANEALRLSWQRQADSVRAENAARLRSPTLVIRAQPWRLVASP